MPYSSVSKKCEEEREGEKGRKDLRQWLQMGVRSLNDRAMPDAPCIRVRARVD